MRDIDILADQSAVPIVEALLRQLGYYQPAAYPPEWLVGSHHNAPFFHPARRYGSKSTVLCFRLTAR
jgi:hypothetical protein